jgi:hypothetical protein
MQKRFKRIAITLHAAVIVVALGLVWFVMRDVTESTTWTEVMARVAMLCGTTMVMMVPSRYYIHRSRGLEPGRAGWRSIEELIIGVFVPLLVIVISVFYSPLWDF